jgi:hypothetical protein
MNKHAVLALSSLLLACTGACQSESDTTPGNAAGSSVSGSGGGGYVPTAGTPAVGGSVAQGGTTAQSGGMAAAGMSGSSAGSTAQAGQGGSSSAGAGGAGGSGNGGGGGAGGLPPLEECQGKASIDRLTSWNASGEGLTVPATGTILVQEGSEYVAKVQFVGAEWHVIPVLIANQFGQTVDLTNASGITLTYSATAELHVQLRSESHWDGGNQYATTIPSTGGTKETRFFSFAAGGWASLFGAPALSYADTLKEGMGLVFVGNSENTVVFYGLRIDGYTPPCN